MSTEFKTIVVQGNEDEDIKQKSIDLRLAVFTDEQGFPAETEIDQYDSYPTTAHIIIVQQSTGQPVGTIRAARLPDGSFKLSRLAVLKDYRSFKLGKALVQALHDYARDRAKVEDRAMYSIVCHSQLQVVAFYEKYGYKAEGELFDEDGAPHQKLVANFTIT